MGIVEIFIRYKTGFITGLLVTLQLCLVIWGSGIVLGTVLGTAGARWSRAVGAPSRAISFVLSGIPVLVLLFWLHYPLQSMLNIVVNPFYTASVALSLINIFAVADVIRTVLREFPEQYTIAARVCGLSSAQTIRHIQFPIIFRQVIPSLLSLQVSMLQMSLFASMISVDEIFRVAQRVNALVYRPIQVYSSLAIFFLLVCLPLNGLAIWLRWQFTRNVSEQ